MAYEDFTTYTEVDPGSDITVAINKVTAANLETRVNSAYVYKDKGANHFSGDFEHLLKCIVSLSEDYSYLALWVMTNDIGAYGQIADVDDKTLLVFRFVDGGASNTLAIQEWTGGSSYSDAMAYTINTLYYPKIKRDEAVGANGTIYAYVYDDSARTNLIDTLSVALSAKTDYRYIYAMSTYGVGEVEHSLSGYVENLDLQEATPTAQPPMTNAIQPVLALLMK